MSNINPMAEIISLMKQLKLSSFVEHLGVHNKTAIANKLTYPEFLTLLLQDEVLRRDQKRFALNIKRSRIRCDKSLENFDLSCNSELEHGKIKDLASCVFIEEKVCVVIVGPCGSGKSHLAHAIGNCAIRENVGALFISASKLMEEIKLAKAINRYAKYKKMLCKLPLLIIDDFGLKPLEIIEGEEFHNIINERYENAATIITSNLDFVEWEQAFPNKLLGVATLDRIRDKAYLVTLEGKSGKSHREFRGKTKIISKSRSVVE